MVSKTTNQPTNQHDHKISINNSSRKKKKRGRKSIHPFLKWMFYVPFPCTTTITTTNLNDLFLQNSKRKYDSNFIQLIDLLLMTDQTSLAHTHKNEKKTKKKLALMRLHGSIKQLHTYTQHTYYKFILIENLRF